MQIIGLMINHINISKQKELEKAFADDFSSPIFPILGELYLNKKDFIRAKKVCEIGLEHDPENINGYYILAKIHLYNNELHKAQEYLEIIIRKKPLHIKALKLIVKLNEELNVSKKNQKKLSLPPLARRLIHSNQQRDQTDIVKK